MTYRSTLHITSEAVSHLPHFPSLPFSCTATEGEREREPSASLCLMFCAIQHLLRRRFTGCTPSYLAHPFIAFSLQVFVLRFLLTCFFLVYLCLFVPFQSVSRALSIRTSSKAHSSPKKAHTVFLSFFESLMTMRYGSLLCVQTHTHTHVRSQTEAKQTKDGNGKTRENTRTTKKTVKERKKNGCVDVTESTGGEKQKFFFWEPCTQTRIGRWGIRIGRPLSAQRHTDT